MVQILWEGKREEGRRNDLTNRELGGGREDLQGRLHKEAGF